MPTSVIKIEKNQIILIASLLISRNVQGVVTTEYKPYHALLDTGSQLTLISQKAIDEGGLYSDEYTTYLSLSGVPSTTKKYKVRIDIPIGNEVVLPSGDIGKAVTRMGKNIEVGVLGYQPENYDILLGMDFLYGFHLTIFGGALIISN